MNKTIILTAVITTLIIGIVYLGFNLLSTPDNTQAIETLEEVSVETINADPTYEYTGYSVELEQRTAKMNSIYSQVEQQYPTQDDTTKKIISLCKAGNVGACSVIKQRGI